MEHLLNAPLLAEDATTRLIALAKLPHDEIRWILINLPPEAATVAAIVIQKRWRGYRVRSHLRRFFADIRLKLQFDPELNSLSPQEAGERYRLVPRLPSQSGSSTYSEGEELFSSPSSTTVVTPRGSVICIHRASLHPASVEPVALDRSISIAELSASHEQLPTLSKKPSETLPEDVTKPPPKKRRKTLKMTKKSAARLALEGAYDRYVQCALKEGKTSAEMMQFVDYCAHRVQTCWLMKHRSFLRARFIQRLIDIHKKKQLESAAAMEVMIQESSMARRKKREGVLTEKDAAVSIQRAWRRHIDIQVYRYYRDLINFKNRGDPSLMLRCINPNEAKLLDSASGTAVRFRLAGDRFPPNIYYKIFTHRPVQDLCANSPKDYTQPETKQLNVRHRHNKIARLPPQEDNKENWYKRFENNGWRLVSDRLLHHIMNDPITWESSKKTYHFDHSKLKRKQDVEKQKKSRKIEWMKKMYKDGMLRARADDQETIQLIEGAAAGMIATVDSHGHEALEDWEVDELLDWTTSLNFEEYFSSWKQLATSAPAENKVEKSLTLGTSNSDPYELTVSTAPSRFQSTRQSRHTPATLNSESIHIRT